MTRVFFAIVSMFALTGCREPVRRLGLIGENASKAFVETPRNIGTAAGFDVGPSGVIKMDYTTVRPEQVLIPTPVEQPEKIPVPDEVTMKLAERDIANATPEQLDMSRAIIAAYGGYIFPEGSVYDQRFRQERWYKPRTRDINVARRNLSRTAYENALMIFRYQNENGLRTVTIKTSEGGPESSPDPAGGMGADSSPTPPDPAALVSELRALLRQCPERPNAQLYYVGTLGKDVLELTWLNNDHHQSLEKRSPLTYRTDFTSFMMRTPSQATRDFATVSVFSELTDSNQWKIDSILANSKDSNAVEIITINSMPSCEAVASAFPSR
jgi:hypothetical protein